MTRLEEIMLMLYGKGETTRQIAYELKRAGYREVSEQQVQCTVENEVNYELAT